MRVVLADIMSADGRLTKGQDHDMHSWTSPEDWAAFVRLRDAQQVVIMDEETYRAVQPQPDDRLLRIVITPEPKRFADQYKAGQLEFVQASPEELLTDIRSRGLERILLAGGVNTAFLKAGLVDELYVTYEPFIFGDGTSLVQDALDIRLKLIEADKLNEQGTLLLHYEVVR